SEGSMNSKGPLQRGFFLIAGPGMNFVAAVVLCIVMVGFQGITSDTSTVYINKVESNSPAAVAGWQPGDAFVAVNGAPVETVNQLSDAIDGFDDKPVTVTLERGDKQIETTVTPRSNPPANQGATGIII